MSLILRLERQRTLRWLHACHSIGDAPRLLGRPAIRAWGRMQIGDRFHLSSRPVPSHLVAGPQGVLDIGSDVSIAHGAAISAFQRVQIGDRTCIGPFVIIMDTNFHGGPGDQSVQHDCRPVIIGRDCRIGSRVTITRGATIGDGTEILAGSVVSSHIPGGVCAGGGRARVLGRAGDAAARWDGAAAVFPALVRDILGLAATPALETEPSRLRQWSAHIPQLLAAVESQFGVTLDPETLCDAAQLSDIVMAIERRNVSRAIRP